jgi:hypothetical protein
MRGSPDLESSNRWLLSRNVSKVVCRVVMGCILLVTPFLAADDRGTGETRTQGGACWRAGTPSTSLRPVPAEAALLSTLRQQFSALQLRVGALTGEWLLHTPPFVDYGK